jgi:hypothetical protein
MPSEKQSAAARKNIKRAIRAAKSKRSIASMPATTRSALGKQGAAVAKRKRSGNSAPKTRQELYNQAQGRKLAGRSKIGRAELAKALGHDA